MEKVSAVYKITNTITGDFYIGSSNDVKQRLACHKCLSTWNKCPDNPLYKDMQKYGVENFEFQVIEEVEIDSLKEKEQQFIETLKPTYNNRNANGRDIEKFKKCQNKYRQSEKGKKCQNKYQKTEKGKESHKKAIRKYQNQLCCFNGETLTLNALASRFRRAGIEHYALEAKKYLIKD